MITSRSPRLIFPHKRRLVNPNLPKYIPFTRVNGLFVLPFNIPTQDPFSPQPPSTTTRSAAPTVLSLPASTSFPFAGLATFNGNFLPTSQHVSESLPDSHAATHPSANLNTNALPVTSQGVVLHGGAHELVDMDTCLLPVDDDTNFTPLGGALGVDQLMLVDGSHGTVTGIVNGDAEEQAANRYGGEPINQRRLETNSLATLNLSLDFLDLRIEDNFMVHIFTPRASSLHTSSLSRSFTSILNINPSNFSYSRISFNNSFNLSTPPFEFSHFGPFSASVRRLRASAIISYHILVSSTPSPLIFPSSSLQHLHFTSSPQFSGFSIPSFFHFSSLEQHNPPPSSFHFESTVSSFPITIFSRTITSSHPILHLNSESTKSLQVTLPSYTSAFSGLAVPIPPPSPLSQPSFTFAVVPYPEPTSNLSLAWDPSRRPISPPPGPPMLTSIPTEACSHPHPNDQPSLSLLKGSHTRTGIPDKLPVVDQLQYRPTTVSSTPTFPQYWSFA